MEGKCFYCGEKTNMLDSEKKVYKCEKCIMIDNIDFSKNDLKALDMLQDIISEDKPRTPKTSPDKAFKRHKSSDLKYLLSFETKDILRDLLKKFGIKNYNSYNKDELIDKVIKNYKHSITEIFECIGSECFKDLNIIVKYNGQIPENELMIMKSGYFLDIYGIVYVTNGKDEGMIGSTPSEIVNLIKDINIGIIKKNDEILNLFSGMVNLYGVLTVEEFLDRLPKECIIDIGISKIKKLISYNQIISEEYNYNIDTNMAYSLSLRTPMFIKEELHNRKITNENIKRFNRNTILLNSNFDEIFTQKIFYPIIKFMQYNYEITIDKILDFIEIIYTMYQIDGLEGIDEFVLNALDVPDFIAKEFIEIIKNSCEKMPTWILGGYSIRENENKLNKSLEEIKEERNELCNCGSGKKYKACCGFNIISLF